MVVLISGLFYNTSVHSEYFAMEFVDKKYDARVSLVHLGKLVS